MNEKKPYSKAIVFLLKKTVENNSPVWNDIITYQKDIQNYLSTAMIIQLLMEHV